MAQIPVSNDEMRTVRDAMRDLNRMIDRLDSGEAEKFVLLTQSRMRAVVVSVQAYSDLCSQARTV